jgi:hypothetical protein
VSDYGFSEGEWRTLQLAPFWIFSALVGSDRAFDELEFAAFSRSVGLAAAAPGRIARAVMATVALDPDRLIEDYRADGRPIAAGLWAVATILSKAPAGEAELFRDVLVSGVGEGVAKARGRFGRTMSEEDEQTLALLAELLA